MPVHNCYCFRLKLIYLENHCFDTVLNTVLTCLGLVERSFGQKVSKHVSKKVSKCVQMYPDTDVYIYTVFDTFFDTKTRCFRLKLN